MALAVSAAPVAASDDDGFEPEIIDMTPDEPAAWSMRNVFAPFSSVFVGGPGYYYDVRELVIDTTPSGGIVDLFYIRSGFQKMFEQAETPVRVILPPRIESLPRDSLRIRAGAPGYRQVETALKIHTRLTELVIDLEPLPNKLEAIAHRYFAGRGSLTFLTEELLQPRLQEEEGGFTVILTETAMSDDAETSLAAVRNALVAASLGQQLGEDLAVRVELQPDRVGLVELRSRQSYDAARDLHVFAIDLLPSDGGAVAVNAAIAALERLRPSHVGSCALRFDEALRGGLDPGETSRALSPRGEFTDRYVRAAMRRFGQIAPGGTVSFTDGATYRPAVPIELDAALSEAASAIGFLAVLRSYAVELDGTDHAEEALRSLVAPELAVDRFAEAFEKAASAERSCLESS